MNNTQPTNKEDKNQKKKTPAVAIVFVVFCVALDILSEIEFGTVVFEMVIPIIIFVMFFVFIAIAIAKNKHKHSEGATEDIFEDNFKKELFELKKQNNPTQPEAQTEEVVLQKYTKECKSCGAKNTEKAKHCDCCGKRI